MSEAPPLTTQDRLDIVCVKTGDGRWRFAERVFRNWDRDEVSPAATQGRSDGKGA